MKIGNMNLNTTVLKCLQVCGDSVLIPDKVYTTLVDVLFEIICQRTNQNVEELLALTPGIKEDLVKRAYYGISTFLVEAARVNSENSSVRSMLEECNWPVDRIDCFVKYYNRNKKDLQIILARYGSSYPHIVDVDWRLDFSLKTNHMEKINEPTYLISLQTEVPGERNDFKLACSIEQLQDLVSKLKDASKTLEKASEI